MPVPPGKALQVLQPLALWLHEEKQGAEDADRGARRDDIESIIAAPLASIDLPATDAGGFLDSIRDRSGLLVERALDVFGFQHQTFQEYLAAVEIAAQGRLALLLDHFGDAYWREVTVENDAFVASLRPPPALELDRRVTATDRLRIWRVGGKSPEP